MPQNNDDLLLAIGRLEGKVDSLLATMRKHDQELTLMDSRIRKLEQHKFLTLGAAAVIGAVASFLIELITD